MPGKICTFYSFKGGVGRTMALANVGFMAAMSGKNVLVMDWDLEAPGLLYYYRGLLDFSSFKLAKEKAGVLDMLWDWKRGMAKLRTKSEAVEFAQSWDNDSSYSKYISEFDISVFNPRGGSLSYVGAGAPNIETSGKKQTYESALTAFDWNRFGSKEFSAVFLQKFRDWVTKTYDYVLIDSRTGLADVAGICTIQMPDTVAMFFVMNKQNIEGTSRVAAAIRQQKQAQVDIRFVPTRVYELNSSEQSDAKAASLDQLTKVGGLSKDTVQADLNNLVIFQSMALPYVETLAVFSPAGGDPRIDPLNLRYLALATQLLDSSISIPDLPTNLIAIVRDRLRPKKPTIEYMETLKVAEPSKAASELIEYIDAAIEAESNDAIYDDEQISALISACFSIVQDLDEPEAELIAIDKLIELLRLKYLHSQDRWRHDLIQALGRLIGLGLNLVEFERSIAAFDEIDDALSEPKLGTSQKIERLSWKLKAAQTLYTINRPTEEVKQTVGALRSLHKSVLDGVAGTQEYALELKVLDAEIHLIQGNIFVGQSDFEKARLSYENGLYAIGSLREIEQDREGTTERPRIFFELSYRIALLPDESLSINAKVMRAIDAAEATKLHPFGIANFSALLDVVLQAEIGQGEHPVYIFFKVVFDAQTQSQRLNLISVMTRSPAVAQTFLKQIRRSLPYLPGLPLGSSIDNLNLTMANFRMNIDRRLKRFTKAAVLIEIYADTDHLMSELQKLSV